jgi:4-diphosphocytidyl-2-C-methyl-D-erythritol kinase
METAMNSITMRAYAKINLGLDVLAKRKDGYHDVSMIMQTIDLYDSIVIKRTKANRISVKTNLSYLPIDSRNLVYKAAALFKETLHLNGHVQICLYKKIPVAAGLAGGSADASAVLRGLNHLYQTHLSHEELMKLGVKLGADVPYCIMMGTALSEGIGEILSPLPPMPDCHILLVKPEINVSTKHVYNNLRLNTSIQHPDIVMIKKSLEKNCLSDLVKYMGNILQTVTIKEYPIITRIKDIMIEKGALTSLMSGSGPTVFGIYEDKNAAKAAHFYFKNADFCKQVILTKPYWPK